VIPPNGKVIPDKSRPYNRDWEIQPHFSPTLSVPLRSPAVCLMQIII